MVLVRLDKAVPPNQTRRGRKQLAVTKRKRKKAPPPLVGELIWKESAELKKLDDAKHIMKIEVETENFKNLTTTM